jgi:ATP-dependent protease HslVU (ClpYQ) peptidase subunit
MTTLIAYQGPDFAILGADSQVTDGDKRIISPSTPKIVKLKKLGVTAGTAKLIGTDKDRIISEICTLLDDDAAYAAMARAHNPFGDGHASQRIAEIIHNARRQET